MVFTPNKNLEQPARGSNVGTWDTPVNSNTGIIDNAFGGTATVTLAGAPLTLSPSQYQCVFITFNGILTSNVAVTFPFVGSFYTIENQTAGSFTVTMGTTVAGSQAICAPPGDVIDIKTDGGTGNVKYRNLGNIGQYRDFCTATVPTWITGCTVPPYLLCDGSAFSAVTYPYLSVYVGGTTLPDYRGRTRFYMNAGTARITAAAGGIDGNTLNAAGGLQTTTISSIHIPNYQLPVTDPGHTHPLSNPVTFAGPGQSGGSPNNIVQAGAADTGSNTTGITVGSGGGGQAFPNLPPGVAGGITMIRAG